MDKPEVIRDLIAGKMQLERTAKQLRIRCTTGLVEVSDAEARTIALELLQALAISDEVYASDEHNRLMMQYLHLRLEATVTKPSGEVELSFAHCWIKEQTQLNAYHIAVGLCHDEGWIVTEVLTQREVFLSDFLATDYLPYYQEALMNEEVVVLDQDADKSVV
jgi:hypothetical protein